MKKLFIIILNVLFAVIFAVSCFAAQVLLNPKFQAFDDNGDPLSGGKVYAYAAGTTSAKDTYTTATLGTPNANPVVLDSRGEAVIYLSGSYKIVLKTSADTTIWTLDNVEGQGSTIVDFSQLSEYADLDAAVTAIGATETVLWIDTDDTMGGDVTIPATTTIIGMQGFAITTTGHTLTVNGGCQAAEDMFYGTGTTAFNDSFEAGLYRVFEGDGTVTFGVGVIKAVHPEWWYDGGGDWEKAIEDAAISITTPGGTVQLSAQSYTVGLTLTNWIKIPSDVIVQGIGPASVIKVVDSNPDYMTIFGPNGIVTTATSNVAFKNFKIDQNITNTTGTIVAGGAAPQYCMYFQGTGSNLIVSDMTFETCSGVNTVHFNAVAMTDVKITNSYFEFERQTGETYDISITYINAYNFVVADNTFDGVINAAADGESCIEVHGGPGTVSGNTIRKFRLGMWIVSESASVAERENSISVIGNTITDANYGIGLYAVGTGTNRDLNGVSVVGNSIQLSQTQYAMINTRGIWLNYHASVAYGDHRDIVIADNIIVFEDEGAGRASQTTASTSYGIGLAPYEDIYNIVVEGNIIKNAPSMGIRVGNSVTDNTSKDVIIKNNIIENAGNNLNAVADNYRVFLFISCEAGAVMQNVRITENVFRETNAALRADATIDTFDGGTITDCYIGNNISHSVNGTMTVDIKEEFSRMYSKTAVYTVTNYDAFNSKLFSNKGGVATYEFDLPAAVIGMKVGFIRLATQTMRIDPNGAETIRGGAAGKYLELNADGEIVWLECVETGQWEIVAHFLAGDAPAYEA